MIFFTPCWASGTRRKSNFLLCEARKRSTGLKKNRVCQSHPKLCRALRKDTLAKLFSMCLSFCPDIVAFVKPNRPKTVLFYYQLCLFRLGRKKSEIFLLHSSYSVKCFRNNLKYLTCFQINLETEMIKVKSQRSI